MNKEIEAVKMMLPNHYTVEPGKAPHSIHCFSKTGIRKGIDAEDDKRWAYFMSSIRQCFGSRFKEVFHNVCFCHSDFTIYLDASPVKEEKI